MSELLDIWITPLIWWLLEVVWVGLGAATLKWPGGKGAVVFFIGVVASFALNTLSLVDTFKENLTGEPLIDYESTTYVILYTALWPAIGATILLGLFLIIMKVQSMMGHLEELSAADRDSRSRQ